MKKILLVYTIAICSINCFAQLPSWLPSNGLVAWYPFNGNANDSSGNNYHGNSYGVALVKDRFGNTNSAYKFSGSQYIEVPYKDPFVAQSHTISCWIKSKQTTLGRLIVLPTVLLPGGGDQHFSLNINIPNYLGGVDSSLVCILFDDVCISGHGHAGVWSSSTSSVTDNNWHHVVGAMDSVNQELRIYVDGQLENIISYPCGPSSYATDNLHFGSYDSEDTTQSYIGILDDIAIYNRVLDSNEIKQLYFAGVPPSVTIADKSTLEGNTPTKLLKFPVTLSNSYSDKVKIKYKTHNNTAKDNSDYVQATGTLVFKPGQTSKTINVTVNGDTNTEQDETFYVVLSNPENATIADDTAIGTIFNDDGVMRSIKPPGIKEEVREIDEKTFNAYPNPVKNTLYIHSKNKATFFLTDANGAKVFTKEINGSGNMDVSKLPAGIYFLKNSLTADVQKIVVEK